MVGNSCRCDKAGRSDKHLPRHVKIIAEDLSDEKVLIVSLVSSPYVVLQIYADQGNMLRESA